MAWFRVAAFEVTEVARLSVALPWRHGTRRRPVRLVVTIDADAVAADRLVAWFTRLSRQTIDLNAPRVKELLAAFKSVVALGAGS